MSPIQQNLLWVALPYASLVLLVAGMIWRWRTDQFGWTSRSSQWNESRILRLASPMFHLGFLMVMGGHVVGLLVPKDVTEMLGVSQHMYHLGATYLGTFAAVMTILAACEGEGPATGTGSGRVGEPDRLGLRTGMVGKGRVLVTPTVSVGGPAATRARTRSAVASSICGRVIETASTSPA